MRILVELSEYWVNMHASRPVAGSRGHTREAFVVSQDEGR